MPPRDRPTESALAEVLAECQGCSWRSTARNAQATAAQHHDRTGHVVRVDVTRRITYGDRDLARRLSGQTSLLDQPTTTEPAA